MAKQFRDFEEAREFVRSLNLKGQKDWKKYCKSGNKPKDIPTNLERTYKDKGWKDLGDFLGTGNVATFNRIYCSFEEARIFVRKLELTGSEDWKKYCKSGNKPKDIPSNPNLIYKKEWKDLGDWLGTGRTREWRDFESAREFVRSLGLKTRKEYDGYCKLDKKPQDIPRSPNTTYKNNGWITWGDFLGNGNVKPRRLEFIPFKEAREFARKLGLKTVLEWREYCKSGDKPGNIPTNIENYYKKEYKGMVDFLGNGNVASKDKIYLSAKEAKHILQKLFQEYKIKNLKDWEKFSKTHGKLLNELNLPSAILQIYSYDNAKKRKHNH